MNAEKLQELRDEVEYHVGEKTQEAINALESLSDILEDADGLSDGKIPYYSETYVALHDVIAAIRNTETDLLDELKE